MVHLDNHISKAMWCCNTRDGNSALIEIEPREWGPADHYPATGMAAVPIALEDSLKR